VTTRAAIYLHVSKGEQTTENPRPDVERVVQTRQLELVSRYAKERDRKRGPIVRGRRIGHRFKIWIIREHPHDSSKPVALSSYRV
jgi:hypothetical protein